MRKKIIFTVCCHLILSFLGLSLIIISLSPPPDTGIERIFIYLSGFISILFGPIMLLLSMGSTIIGILFLIGIVSGIFEVFLITNEKYPLLLLIFPAIVWCTIGTYGLYLGLIASI